MLPALTGPGRVHVRAARSLPEGTFIMRRISWVQVTALLGLVTAAAAGACSASAGSDGGAAECQALAACCANTAGAQSQVCLDVVESGVASDCTQELVAYQTAGSCGTTASSGGTVTGTGCGALATCCAAMSGPAASACDAIVQEGVSTTCTEELSVYQTTRACGGATTGTGTGGGTSTGTQSACSSLATCCAEMSGAQQQACSSIAAGGATATCAAELEADEAAGLCAEVGPGSGTSGGNPGSGSGGNSKSSGFGGGSTSSGFGGTTSSGSDTGTASSSAADCTPHALPAGFVFRTVGVASGSCTAADDEGIGSCVSMGTSCAAYESTPGCGPTCAFTTSGASAWGPFIYVTAAGAGNIALPFVNLGGCIQKVDRTSAGAACAAASARLFQCELEACIAYCPIASASDTAGAGALLGTSTSNGCLGDADTTVCAEYASAESSACATDFSDASTSAATLCDNLLDASDQGPYVALFCGGEDAGI